MRIARVSIANFRNFRDADCRFGRHAVLLGENGAGKSNFLHAVRLVLDASLPDSERYLEAEDFWSGVAPFGGTEVSVSVYIDEYKGNLGAEACLFDFQVAPPPGAEPPVARLTYLYAPRPTLADKTKATQSEYSFTLFGGDDISNHVGKETREWVQLRVLPALRDAGADLRVWRKSPLRPLIERLQPLVPESALSLSATSMDAATAKLLEEAPVKGLQDDIRKRLARMIGDKHPLKPTLGFGATETSTIIRLLRLFADEERSRAISETSLGLANVAYLALLLLDTEQAFAATKHAGLIMGIEEPEAHLHPQLQRLVFRDLLRRTEPILVSTHSPNIASVAPLRSLAVLSSTSSGTRIASIAGSDIAFTDEETADLERYLDVTRAEVLFSRAAILVEGVAEQFVVPRAAELILKGSTLDEHAISICSVSGTDFLPYCKLFAALKIPYVVLTDGDPLVDKKTGAVTRAGLRRGIALLGALGIAVENLKTLLSTGKVDDLQAGLASHGIFVGLSTLEVDFAIQGAGARLAATYKDFMPGAAAQTVSELGVAPPVSASAATALVDRVESVGKGRFAQRFASRLTENDIPEYIRKAIAFAVQASQQVAP